MNGSNLKENINVDVDRKMKKMKRNKDNSSGENQAVSRQMQIAQRLVCWKNKRLTRLVRELERWDRSITAQQRQLVFYLGLLSCSGWLLYLLGSCLRQPSKAFYTTSPAQTDRWYKRPSRVSESNNFYDSVNAVRRTGDPGHRKSGRMNFNSDKGNNKDSHINSDIKKGKSISIPVGKRVIYFQHKNK